MVSPRHRPLLAGVLCSVDTPKFAYFSFDTVTLGVLDAPRPDEIVVAIGIADGGRVNPRVGKQRIL